MGIAPRLFSFGSVGREVLETLAGRDNREDTPQRAYQLQIMLSSVPLCVL